MLYNNNKYNQISFISLSSAIFNQKFEASSINWSLALNLES